jgi:hypothetical protein
MATVETDQSGYAGFAIPIERAANFAVLFFFNRDVNSKR